MSSIKLIWMTKSCGEGWVVLQGCHQKYLGHFGDTYENFFARMVTPASQAAEQRHFTQCLQGNTSILSTFIMSSSKTLWKMRLA